MKVMMHERRNPFRDNELKQVLMEQLFHKKAELLVYQPAWSPDSYTGVDFQRKVWQKRVRAIYNSIEGFAQKPRLGMEWNHNGDLYIQLCW